MNDQTTIKCPTCGMKFTGTIGYYCGNAKCPLFIKAVLR